MSPSSVELCRHEGRDFLSIHHVYGGPVSSALIEELAYYGVSVVLAYGLAGSLGRKRLGMGDLYLVERALARDGTTPHYSSSELVDSDHTLNRLVRETAEARSTATLEPVQALTTDAIYRGVRGRSGAGAPRWCDIVNCDSSHLFAASRAVGIRSTECGVVSDVASADGREWDSTLAVMLQATDDPVDGGWPESRPQPAGADRPTSSSSTWSRSFRGCDPFGLISRIRSSSEGSGSAMRPTGHGCRSAHRKGTDAPIGPARCGERGPARNRLAGSHRRLPPVRSRRLCPGMENHGFSPWKGWSKTARAIWWRPATGSFHTSTTSCTPTSRRSSTGWQRYQCCSRQTRHLPNGCCVSLLRPSACCWVLESCSSWVALWGLLEGWVVPWPRSAAHWFLEKVRLGGVRPASVGLRGAGGDCRHPGSRGASGMVVVDAVLLAARARVPQQGSARADGVCAWTPGSRDVQRTLASSPDDASSRPVRRLGGLGRGVPLVGWRARLEPAPFRSRSTRLPDEGSSGVPSSSCGPSSSPG